MTLVDRFAVASYLGRKDDDRSWDAVRLTAKLLLRTSLLACLTARLLDRLFVLDISVLR